MSDGDDPRMMRNLASRHVSHVALPWFSFIRGRDPLSHLRRQAFAWQASAHPKSNGRRLSAGLRWPLAALRNSLEASRKWAAAARSDGAGPRWVQCLSMWWLGIRHNLSYRVYYTYRLWQPRPGATATSWIDEFESYLIYQLFRQPDKAGLLDDKLAFHHFCVEHRLPTLPLIATISANDGTEWFTDAPGLPATDLFAKPATLARGRGAMAYSYDRAQSCWRRGDVSFGEGELLALLTQSAAAAPVILQTRMTNHPDLNEFSPDALCTMRCMTYRYDGQQARHFRSLLRMGRAGMIVDHPLNGGLCAPIDEKGVLGKPRSRLVGRSTDRHPDTGALIAGRPMPACSDMQALALRAHDALGAAGLISWDVALTVDGPILVEGNSLGSLELVQSAHDEPLGNTEFVTIVARLIAEHGPGKDSANR